MNNVEFDKKSTVLGQFTLEENDNKNLLENHHDDIPEFLIGGHSEILPNVRNVLEGNLEDSSIDNGNIVEVLVQKEASGTDINIQNNITETVQKEASETAITNQNNLTENALKDEIASAEMQTDLTVVQNNLIENNDEQEVSTKELQSSMGIENETNKGIIECKLDDRSELSPTSKSLENAKRELQVPETGRTIQNVLVDKVEKLDISEKTGNKDNKSEVIVKNKSQSLKNLLVYSDEDEYDDGESNDVNKIEDKKPPKEPSSSSSDSESDSSSDSDSDPEILGSDDSCSESESEPPKKNLATSQKSSKNTEDLYTADLPPITDLSKLVVDYEKEEFSHIGEITGIIETIVTINTISGTPVYDLGSILFIDDDDSKKPLGEIFDVIGPVASPVYCIGFRSAKEIKELGIEPKMKVYSAPNSHLSHYVFLKQLLEAKHTDASGLSDEELSSDEYNSDSGDERLPQKRKSTTLKTDTDHHRKGNTRGRGRGRQTMKHSNYRNRQVEPNGFNGQHAQNVGGGQRQNSFASNFSGSHTAFNPSVPPPLYQNNIRWNTPPNAHPPPSWNNGESTNPTKISEPPQNWNTPPNLRTPTAPQWHSNPSFNGVHNMPPPPPHWNSCPRLGFPPNVHPPQRFAGYRQNAPTSDPSHFNRSYRHNYSANTFTSAPPRWQPRTHPYQPYGSGFPNAPPMIGHDQSFNYPAKDVP